MAVELYEIRTRSDGNVGRQLRRIIIFILGVCGATAVYGDTNWSRWVKCL